MNPPTFTHVTRTALIALTLALTACGGDGKGGSAKITDPPPARPTTGAPLAFEVTKVTPGEDRKGELETRAYNFSDKKIAGYGIMMRYLDKDGKVTKVNVGTPFEKDHDSWSMSGPKFACEPSSWCSFKIDSLNVPAAAVKAEIVAHSLRAIAADGVAFEQPDLFSLPGGGLDWPK